MAAIPVRIADRGLLAPTAARVATRPRWLTAEKPWSLILLVALPFWLASGIVSVTTFMLTVMPEQSVLLLPVETRFAHQGVLALLAMFGYRLSLAIGWPKERRVRAVLCHVLVAIVFGIASRPILIGLGQVTMPEPPDGGWSALQNFTGWGFNLWMAAALDAILRFFFGLAVLFGVRASLALHDAELARSELENAWMSARLQALRMQLNPHFLFNAFNSVATLLDSQPARARALVLNISDLFQRTLATADEEWATLRDELEFARDYMSIQKARFEDRFSFEIAADRALLDARLPAMLLQPLVENAAVHGVADDRDSLAVRVSARREAGALVVEVRNQTTGRLPPGRASRGIGLSNTESRLATCYGARASLVCTRPDDSTYVVVVRVPLQE